MKTLLLVLTLFLIPNASAFAQNQKQQQKQQQQINKLAPGKRAAVDRPAIRRAVANSLAEDAVTGYYVKQFQQVTEVSPEVLGRVVPFVQEFVQERFDISRRRTRALNQLRQGLARGVSDEDYKRLVHDLDSADADFQGNQERFLSSVDPLLNARQQAQVRILQASIDTVIRQALQTVQNRAAQQQQNAAPATPPQN